MTYSVIDENVLVVANGRAEHVDDVCQEACIDFLLERRDDRKVLLDRGYEMLDKYSTHCSYSGQPGVGDYFFLWLHDHASRLQMVDLCKDEAGEYIDFPSDPALKKFDQDDRLYVAAVLASDVSAQLVNASDSDYSHFAEALDANGVEVMELCPHTLKESSGPDGP